MILTRPPPQSTPSQGGGITQSFIMTPLPDDNPTEPAAVDISIDGWELLYQP